MELISADISKAVLGAAYEVQNSLGCGFLEKVYENALALELRRAGFAVEQQRPIQVRYRHVTVGEYYADLCVAQSLIVELKAARQLDSVHEAQCINYLKASGIPLCLLINFGRPRLQYRRFVHQGQLQREPRMHADEAKT